MTFSTFLIVLIVAYAIYYGIIIFLDLSKKNISEEKEQNYSNIEIDEDEFKAVDASKIYAETIGKTPPVQAEDVAEEPKDESSIMNGAQSETVSVSDSSESSPEDDNPEMSDMETAKQISAVTNQGLLAHFTQIYHLYNLLIYNILRRNLQLFITEFCIFSPCIIFISNKNSDKSIEILHISPKYITSVDNLMIHIFSSTFNFLYSFTPSDRLESKS